MYVNPRTKPCPEKNACPHPGMVRHGHCCDFLRYVQIGIHKTMYFKNAKMPCEGKEKWKNGGNSAN